MKVAAYIAKEIFMLQLFMTVLLMLSVGCKTTHTAQAGPSVHDAFAIPIVHSKQDTPKTVRPFSRKEFQEYLRQQYKINYDDLIAPDQRRLYAVIESQAKSLAGMQQYMQVTRHKTDSIARERNFFRNKVGSNDSIYQRKVLELQNTIIKLYNRVLEQEKRSQAENKAQIAINRKLTISCLVGVLILAIVFVFLNKRIKKLSTKLDTVLIKYQDNA